MSRTKEKGGKQKIRAVGGRQVTQHNKHGML